MAAASLLALLDDIATLLDDVSVMTKTAAAKTSGVLGDDLALNAQQVHGVDPDRELPVVWAVAKGSLKNKAILVPAALAISAFAPWAVTPLLMLGGTYLCFEGAEKLLSRWLPHGASSEVPAARPAPASIDPTQLEADKIAGAVRTDFVLSAEIIVIALGTVAEAPLGQRVAVLVGIAVLMTVGVYGLVAAIVKADDFGLWLSVRPRALSRAIGRGILRAAPRFMRALSVLGTAAMFTVGGGILAHGLPPLHHAIEAVAEQSHNWPPAGAWPAVLTLLLGAGVGLALGALVAGAWGVVQRLRGTGPTG
ncbi:hypothetical protein EDC62_1204 [Tibeticola sediminis]|uniref:Inner membrane protein YedI n=1 Tax=Tibeticola sediminis TaxID=1917811 RepID=A0A3N4V0X0_9BURK|nr:DUF808 domain-containing protein [Tibeticola sediminis]RPE70717.1 hypothetical protein EDC62_1204 [Tibeticola sediminis]